MRTAASDVAAVLRREKTGLERPLPRRRLTRFAPTDRRRAGEHERPPPDGRFGEAEDLELVIRSRHRFPIHAELPRQDPDRLQLRPGTQPSGVDRSAEILHDLLRHGLARPAFDGDQHAATVRQVY
jgi:hypothetical protein